MTEITPLILGSAAVGALTSSIISLIGQAVERRARKRELILSKSIELAELHVSLLKDAASATGGVVDIQPYIFYTRWHHRELEQLLDKSKLSSALEAQYRDEMGDVSFNPAAKKK